jgi:methionyl-tRNA formyltransferase
MNIFIDGYGVVAHSILRKLVENHNISSDKIFVNTYFKSENQLFLDYLKENNINHADQSYRSIFNELSGFSPDLFFTLYGRRIIPPNVLSKVKLKSVNLHPSLLPEYKGCFSCPWVILNRENKTGITFHEIVEEVDSGDILFQHEIKLNGDETAYSLYHILASEFIQKFDDFFLDLLNSDLTPKKMLRGGNYYPRKVPYDGLIDVSWSPVRIESFIRAMYFPPFKGAILNHQGREMEIENFEQYHKLIST